MGLVEVVLEHVSVKAAVLWIVGSWVLYLVVKNVLEERKINKLGARAARMPSRLPLSQSNHPPPSPNVSCLLQAY